MAEGELDERLREFQTSSFRYGKTIAEVTQIAIRITTGHYTPKKPLEVIEVYRNELYREQAEKRVARLKELIKEIFSDDYADYILERIKFEIKPMPKVKPKPFEWVVIEDYVDIFRESEEA